MFVYTKLGLLRLIVHVVGLYEIRSSEGVVALEFQGKF